MSYSKKISMLVSKDKKFQRYDYTNKESELQKVVEEYADDIFGQYTFFFPKKKLKSSKFNVGAIPDGFLLDLSDPDNPIFYVIEVELKSHKLSHIAPQILRLAISYKESKPQLKRIVKETIRSDSKLEKKIDNRIKESRKFKHLDELLDEAMDKDIPNMVVPIDEVEKSLNEIPKYITIPVIYIPIETYKNPETGEMNHVFRHTLYAIEEETRPTEVGTFYRFLIDKVKIVNIPRSEFDRKHSISKHAQGYTFIRDEKNEPTGIVFWWFKNRLEKHIKEDITQDKKTWAGTARPVDPSSFKLGMDVYIGETFWDKDTHKKTDNPKYRIHGKLEEIYLVSGGKETKIFPLESASK